ncbi:MAG: hypothetical protein ACAI44_19425, partial [Candidatus Sericytochromatia bacterium]
MTQTLENKPADEVRQAIEKLEGELERADDEVAALIRELDAYNSRDGLAIDACNRRIHEKKMARRQLLDTLQQKRQLLEDPAGTARPDSDLADSLAKKIRTCALTHSKIVHHVKWGEQVALCGYRPSYSGKGWKDTEKKVSCKDCIRIAAGGDPQAWKEKLNPPPGPMGRAVLGLPKDPAQMTPSDETPVVESPAGPGPQPQDDLKACILKFLASAPSDWKHTLVSLKIQLEQMPYCITIEKDALQASLEEMIAEGQLEAGPYEPEYPGLLAYRLPSAESREPKAEPIWRTYALDHYQIGQGWSWAYHATSGRAF